MFICRIALLLLLLYIPCNAQIVEKYDEAADMLSITDKAFEDRTGVKQYMTLTLSRHNGNILIFSFVVTHLDPDGNWINMKSVSIKTNDDTYDYDLIVTKNNASNWVFEIGVTVAIDYDVLEEMAESEVTQINILAETPKSFVVPQEEKDAIKRILSKYDVLED